MNQPTSTVAADMRRVKRNEKGDKMNKSKLVWGIICLVIAAVLAYANISLPSNELMFMVGEENMPWVPVIIVGIIGIALLSTANQPKKDEEPIVVDPEKDALNKRLETTAFGCFLIMLGGFLFVPQEIIRGGWWSIGVGLIFLALNAARYIYKLRMSGFTTVLGILSIIGGIFDLLGMPRVNGAILIIIIGVYIIFKPYFEKRRLFGKAEQE
jgi:hypothetical protein